MRVCYTVKKSNIMYGFPECKKDPGIDLRIVYDPKELIIRIQENCPAVPYRQTIAEQL